MCSTVLPSVYTHSLPHPPRPTHKNGPQRVLKDPKDDEDPDILLSRISSWVDTRYSVKKALEHFMRCDATVDHHDTFLTHGANRRFLELHHDVAEECGPGDRQHSWAAIEKRNEVLIHGPYFPDYARGQHSEDLVVRQTEELLAAEGGCEVYVFTLNSPCLDRDTQPCMLHLVEKALEWHALYGVKTHIGYAKCWGFKGNKEALFRDVDRKQLECVRLSRDGHYEGYVEAVKNCPEGNLAPLSRELLSAVRQRVLLGEGSGKNLKFTLTKHAAQEQSWKSSFKSLSDVSTRRETQVRSEAPTQEEMDSMTEAAEALVFEGRAWNLEEHIERGRTFAREEYIFAAETCEAARARARLAFVRCWTDVVEGRYAEVVRERMTDDFNRCVTCLFSEDVAKLDKDYVQIGRIRFSEGLPPSERCLLGDNQVGGLTGP